MQRQDIRAAFQRLRSTAMEISCFDDVIVLVIRILQFVDEDNNQRNQAALDSLPLGALMKCAEISNSDQIFTPYQRGTIRTIASLIVVAYLLCSQESILSVMVYSDRIEGGLLDLEHMANIGETIKVNDQLQVPLHHLRYIPMEARRF